MGAHDRKRIKTNFELLAFIGNAMALGSRTWADGLVTGSKESDSDRRCSKGGVILEF